MKYNIFVAILINITIAQLNPNLEGKNYVKILGEDNFNDIILNSGEKRILVFFGSENCVHCKNFVSTYNKLAYDHYMKEKENVILAKVECNRHQNICLRFFINGYPSFGLFHKSKYHRFEKNRSYEALSLFIEKDFLNSKKEDFRHEIPTLYERTIVVFKEISSELYNIYKTGPKSIKIVLIIIMAIILIVFLLSIFMCYQIYTDFKSDREKVKND